MIYKALRFFLCGFLLLSINEITGQTPHEVCQLIKRELKGPIGLPGPPGPAGNCNRSNEMIKLLHEQLEALKSKRILSNLILE